MHAGRRQQVPDGGQTSVHAGEPGRSGAMVTLPCATQTDARVVRREITSDSMTGKPRPKCGS